MAQVAIIGLRAALAYAEQLAKAAGAGKQPPVGSTLDPSRRPPRVWDTRRTAHREQQWASPASSTPPSLAAITMEAGSTPEV